MMLLQGDFGPALGVAALALALAAAVGAAGARSPLALALHLMVTAACLGAALAGFGAAGAGLVAAAGLGAAAPLLAIAAFALAPQAARLRKDGPPLGSLAVAAGLALVLIWAGHDTPSLVHPRPAETAPAALSLLISLAVAAMAAAALGAMALLGFGERAETLRQVRLRRKLKAKLPEEDPS